MNYEMLEAKLNQADEETQNGNYDEAEHLANEVLAELDSFHFEEGRDGVLSRALLTLGNVSRMRGNFPAALEHYASALGATENANDISGIAKAMTEFGNVYVKLGSYDKALEYYGKALALLEELGEKSSIARVTGNIGIVYCLLALTTRHWNTTVKL
ncbi:MAG: tetratricopeptide repeat protein [Ignavibacteria bacterium]|nr:tetratricopeptide repeat protein [Ignavibacteria bacterium]